MRSKTVLAVLALVVVLAIVWAAYALTQQHLHMR